MSLLALPLDGLNDCEVFAGRHFYLPNADHFYKEVRKQDDAAVAFGGQNIPRNGKLRTMPVSQSTRLVVLITCFCA